MVSKTTLTESLLLFNKNLSVFDLYMTELSYQTSNEPYIASFRTEAIVRGESELDIIEELKAEFKRVDEDLEEMIKEPKRYDNLNVSEEEYWEGTGMEEYVSAVNTYSEILKKSIIEKFGSVEINSVGEGAEEIRGCLEDMEAEDEVESTVLEAYENVCEARATLEIPDRF